MAIGPLARLGIQLLKNQKAVISKGIQQTAKIASKTTKKVAASASRVRANAKAKIATAFGTAGILGGTIGGMLSGKLSGLQDNESDVQTASDSITGIAEDAIDSNNIIPPDPLISFTGLTEAISAALPSIDKKSKGNNVKHNKAGVIVRRDTKLDTVELSDNTEIPIIPAGTYIHTRIPEIGQLFLITDLLRDQIDIVSNDLDQTNFELKRIADQIGIAIDVNRTTARRNERRRDEEDVENKNEKEKVKSFIGERMSDVANVAKAGVLVTAMKYSKTAAAFAAYAVLDAMADDEEQIQNTDTNEDIETTPEESETITPNEEMATSIIDNTITWIEKASSDDADKTIVQSLTGAALSTEVMALGIAGTVGSMVAPSGAAAAGLTSAAVPIAAAAAGGYVLGSVIYEQTGLREGISDVIGEHLAGDTIDLGTMASDEALREKYKGKRGVELLGDLLGEGVFDLAEPPAEIISAFRDVDSVEKYQELDTKYNATYGRTLTSALNDVIGTNGVDSVFQLITQNSVEKIKRESVEIPVNQINENISIPDTTQINEVQILTNEKIGVPNITQIKGVEKTTPNIVPIVITPKLPTLTIPDIAAGNRPGSIGENASPVFSTADTFLQRSLTS